MEKAEVFTDRQKEVISAFKNGRLKRINILEGSVRSGKTYISIVLFALFVAYCQEDSPFLMTGKTLNALKRNVLVLLQDLVGTQNFKYSMSSKEGRLFGRIIYLEGANDESAESKIRGMTLMGAYCDEITLYPESFFSMMLSRLSLEGAKLIGTTNTDNPKHWLKVRYLDRVGEISLLKFKFLIEDNSFLSKDYIENIKKEYTGAFYEKFILGLWKSAEGLIYANFKEEFIVSNNDVPSIQRYWIGIDYGQSNSTVFLLCGEGIDKRIYILDEYCHSGRADAENKSPVVKSPYTYAKDFVNWVKWYFEIRGLNATYDAIYYDPSALGFRTQLAQLGISRLKKADNDVTTGIQLVSSMYEAGIIRVVDKCKNFINEVYSYSWDDKAAKIGLDKPIKANDHAMDAFRYLCMGNKQYWKKRVTAELREEE